MTIITGTAAAAAPKIDPILSKIAETAELCVDKLEGGETTSVCAAIIRNEFKSRPAKLKKMAVETIAQRLWDRKPDPRSQSYLKDLRDDLLKRVSAGEKEEVYPKEGVRLIRFGDILARAATCLDRRYAYRNVPKCIELIKSKPLDLSIIAQVHTVRVIEEIMKRHVKPKDWETIIYPFIKQLIDILIKDSI